MPFADADRKCSGRPVRDGRRLCCFHLSHFRGISVPGGDFAASTCHGFLAFLCQVAALLFPPVTVSWHFRGRWAFSTSHLSQFRGISEPGGIFSASTCHTFAAFLSQVACFRLHLSHFRGISVPGGDFAAPTCHSFVAFLCRVATLLLPPVTVSRHFRARWRLCCSHLSQFRGISVPGGNVGYYTRCRRD